MHVLILSLLVVAAPAAPGASPKWVSEPIVTRQTAFTIPYQIDRPQQISQEPVEVQLYVSSDRGTNWRPAGKASPLDGKIPFQTTGDGEFWFAVRTLDRAGQARPELSAAPVLRVLVDTTPPGLTLTARRGQAGQVTAQWEIRDQALKPESLRIHYRTGGEETWQPVAVSPANYQVKDGLETGEVTWWPAGASSILQVRAECVDKAGNPGVSHAQVMLASARQAPPSAFKIETPKIEAPQTPAPAAAAPVLVAPAQPAPPPVAVAAQPALPRAGVAAQPAPGPALAPAQLGPAQPTLPKTASLPQPNSMPAAAAPAAPLAAPVAPIAAPIAAPASPVTPLAPVAAPVASAPARPRMVNARVFQLEYDVSGAGPTGVSRVELWGTRDGGRTWTSYAVDDDNRSPLVVKINDEGLYGFRVAVRCANGSGGEPPRSGDAPQIAMGVDLTPPTARIAAIQPVPGRAGQMMIAWDATDFLLAERPIAIFYSPGSSGPWTPIASGLENNGAYAWTAPAGVPDGIFIRLEVRDEAGNVASVQTPGPVALQRELPTARIRDIRPVGPSVAPMLYR